ncbi:MAG: rod shape-determining protein [Lachnospiraceae bacterium]|nr:rod shape-determining protein [Lachnospiraceae bacterium]
MWKTYSGQSVFGLDIGTRSIVGTVGYKAGDRFIIVAQKVKEHETRAMLDGQIHDIEKVGAGIMEVKEALEKEINRPLTDVCIAAAGRVLETVTAHAEVEYEEDHRVTKEDIFSLKSMAVENAYTSFLENNTSSQKFYCVGNSVIAYYLNDFKIGNLENHGARKIAVDLIATFLPDEVVDGLHKSVELAGLQVVNMTLEPIAAIQVAIPERFRLLNIALVDVGAGTSDISITKDGSIVAYGMIPMAGDKLTEEIALHCLTDFYTAEQMKKDMLLSDTVVYEDIMGLKQTIETSRLEEIIDPVLEDMTDKIARQIMALNGDKAVSAVFVVGGGGKAKGFTEKISAKLGILAERVALRGADVMQRIEFPDDSIQKDSLLVTPIGICLNFYEQDNNFIYVSFNNRKVKLYDNKNLTVTDAAIQAQFPSDGFFPRRGRELNFTVNGVRKIVRGEPGEGAVITVNGKPANVHTAIKKDDIIKVQESTAGAPARMEIGRLAEFKSTIAIEIDGKKMVLPKFASVGGSLKSEYYEIQEQDDIRFLDYYTLAQILEFLDLEQGEERIYFVNNKQADLNTKVYENFSVHFVVQKLDFEAYKGETLVEETRSSEEEGYTLELPETVGLKEDDGDSKAADAVTVVVNGEAVAMQGKEEYIFVDVFDFISFDLSKPQGAIVTTLNGHPAQFMEPLQEGDELEIYWRT